MVVVNPVESLLSFLKDGKVMCYSSFAIFPLENHSVFVLCPANECSACLFLPENIFLVGWIDRDSDIVANLTSSGVCDNLLYHSPILWRIGHSALCLIVTVLLRWLTLLRQLRSALIVTHRVCVYPLITIYLSAFNI